MKNKKSKIKSKNLVIVVITIILIVIGILIYFGIKNNKVETSGQPVEENFVDTNIYEENNIIEVPENTIEENIPEENNTATNENKTTNSNNVKNTNIPYYIKVNYGAQVVTIYKKDSNGEYTVPVKAMICSTGVSTPTSGVYTIPARWTWGALFGNVYGQYCVKITGNILFHSVPYLRKGDNASLEYWEYDKLGTAASAGCIRLKVEDLIWLYNNCGNGTKVEFYSSSNPGPLGKPTAKKISSYPDYLRNWDPTDPNPNNPWKSYKEEENTKTDNKQNETTNTTKPDNTVKNEVKNEVTNNTTNDAVKNEVTNNITNNVVKNEVTNNTINNTVKNENTNSTVNNTTKNEVTNTTKSNNAVNANK